jgi:hypothetical protein
MWARMRNAVQWNRASCLLACLLLVGCNRGSVGSDPQITFSKIPPSDAAGPDRLDPIEGRASGAKQGQQIVLYAKSEGRWWIQPSPDDPFTKIQSDAKWQNQTHLGTEYAALLVDPNYYPAENTLALPSQGGGVKAVAIAKGQSTESATPRKTLHFSGYDWIVRIAPSHRGGSRNTFDPGNAWVDESGALHLRIAKVGDQFSCAEVQLSRSLGYGTYVFVVRDISHLEASAVLTLFTWDGAGPEENRRELAFEISRWGSYNKDNSTFMVQPYYIPTNFVRFYSPPGVLTNSFHWEPGRVTFTTYAGSHVTGRVPPLEQRVFSSGVPAAGGDAARMNLYIFRKGEIPLQHENEIVIERFEYYP